MRITRKKYDRAKAVVADAREQMQVIKRWDEAIKHVERPELSFDIRGLTNNFYISGPLPGMGGPLSPGTYRTWVRAFDGAGRPHTWSRPVDFTFDEVSQATTVQLTTPFTATFDRTPTFTWDVTTPPGTVHQTFDVFLTDGETAIEQSGITQTQWTPNTELSDGEWHLWVRPAVPEGLVSAWSQRQTIAVNGPATVLAPADDITAAMPVFQWTAVNGAARYILHVENAAGDIVIRENNLTDVTFAAATELPADSYRVWVQAISATDRSFDIWSRALSFTINSVT